MRGWVCAGALVFLWSSATAAAQSGVTQPSRADLGALRTAGWSIGSVGVAMTLLALVAVGAREDAIVAYNDSARAGTCPAAGEDGRVPEADLFGRATVPGCYELESRWRMWAELRDGFGITGAMLLTTGVALIVLGEVVPDAPPEVASMRLSPLGDAGLAVTLTF
jgi:hypothetical protein